MLAYFIRCYIASKNLPFSNNIRTKPNHRSKVRIIVKKVNVDNNASQNIESKRLFPPAVCNNLFGEPNIFTARSNTNKCFINNWGRNEELWSEVRQPGKCITNVKELFQQITSINSTIFLKKYVCILNISRQSLHFRILEYKFPCLVIIRFIFYYNLKSELLLPYYCFVRSF